MSHYNRSTINPEITPASWHEMREHYTRLTAFLERGKSEAVTSSASRIDNSRKVGHLRFEPYDLLGLEKRMVMNELKRVRLWLDEHSNVFLMRPSDFKRIST
jgi:hypothetical protein